MPSRAVVALLAQLVLVAGHAPRIFFDVSAADVALGRLEIRLLPAVHPSAVENVRLLATGERTAIDGALSYRGCAFDFSPAYVEGPQYKWAHILKGRGRNALRPVADRALLAPWTVRAFGGTYYGPTLGDDSAEAARTVLTVPVQGPGRATSRVALVRVRDSPPPWRERLLLNQAVIGVLEEGEDVLERMASSREPPVVADCGELEV